MHTVQDVVARIQLQCIRVEQHRRGEVTTLAGGVRLTHLLQEKGAVRCGQLRRAFRLILRGKNKEKGIKNK